jgi:hypothetical protein
MLIDELDLIRHARHSERSEESNGTHVAASGSENPAGFFASLRMTNRDQHLR